MKRPSENLAEVLEALAAGQPAAPLLHLPGCPALTYADLREQIGYVRDRLGDWGIARGDIVAGCIDSRPHMALACAALPSASTFAPLSASLTEDGYAALLDRLRPVAVLVEGALTHPLRAAAEARGIAEIRVAPDPAAAFGRFRLDGSSTRPRGGGDGHGGGDHCDLLHGSLLPGVIPRRCVKSAQSPRMPYVYTLFAFRSFRENSKLLVLRQRARSSILLPATLQPPGLEPRPQPGAQTMNPRLLLKPGVHKSVLRGFR